MKTFANVAALPPLPADLPRLISVPIDAEVAASVCPVALQQLSWSSPWLRLLPEDLACRRLVEDASTFHAAHFTGLPAFSLDTTPIPSNAEAIAFKILGLDYSFDSEGAGVFAAAPQDRDRPISQEMDLLKQKHAIVIVVGL